MRTVVEQILDIPCSGGDIQAALDLLPRITVINYVENTRVFHAKVYFVKKAKF